MLAQAKSSPGFFILTFFCLTFSSGASLAAVPDSGCFDLTQGIKPLARTLAPEGASGSGELPKGGSWASAHVTIARPLRDLVGELRSHEVTKSGRASVMVIKDITDSLFFLRQTVHFEVHPFPLVNVQWDEDWAFTLTNGTTADPERVLVAYQKAQGTSHIEHLCGNYVLVRKGPQATEVTLYEEAQATGRSREDTEKGVRSTLKNLDRTP